MSRSFLAFLILTFSLQVAAQQNAQLATSSVRTFTTADLSQEARAAWEQRDRSFAAHREQLLSQMVSEQVLELEAKSSGLSVAKLVERVRARIADPTETEIKQTYDANLKELENKSLSEVRTAIVKFLRREPEERALRAYVDELAAKYRVSYEMDVNAVGLKPVDILFSANGRNFTAQDFENQYRLALNEAKFDLYDNVRSELDAAIMNLLVETDAAASKMDNQAYLAREITDKMKSFSDDERAELIDGLKTRLFAKYKVKYLISPPPVIVQKISVDDDPGRGPLNAPVTVVMFADFQCPACSQTHPILQKVIAEFPGKVRFVARDFPLENIHENAFKAAVAAGAANAQGKFFEYGEMLYRNQSALDDESLKKYASAVGLNMRQFEIDFTSAKTAAEVRHDIADGTSYGVTGTPTIFVNGVMVRRLSAADFREAIRNALARTSTPARTVSPRRK